jgi:hypothetical protein
MTRNQRRPKEEKPNQLKEPNMKLKIQTAVITLALAVSTSLVSSQDRQPQRLRSASPTIVGVWQMSRQGVNCNDPNQLLGPPFPAIVTFHGDGTMTGAAKSAVAGPFDTPEYGSWQREPGTQNYSFRTVALRYDANGIFLGQLVSTANVNLTGDSLTSSATIQIFDANGNLIATGCGTATATRFE